MTDEIIRYKDVAATLLNRILEDLQESLGLIKTTTRAAEIVNTAIGKGEALGYPADTCFVTRSSLSLSYHKVKNCSDFLPILELFDSLGFEATGSSDFAFLKNRDYHLSGHGISLKLEVYFTDSNCRKVPIGSEIQYRLECNSDLSIQQTKEPNDGIPF